jgi:hypothetical protein
MAPARRFSPSSTAVSGVLLLLLSGTALSAQTLTITRPDAPPGVGGPLATVLPAGRDFATEVLGDPWDFEQESDWIRAFSLDGLDPTTSAWMDAPVLAGGAFKGRSRTTLPVLSLQFEGVGSTLNLAARTGVRFPIDASKYTRLSFRLRRSVVPADAGEDLLAAHWYKKATRAADQHSFGQHLFTSHGWNPHAKAFDNQMPPATQTTAGEWQVYKVDLGRPATALDTGESWADAVLGFELRLGRGAELNGADVEIDWVRLTEPGMKARISLSGFAGPVTLTARHESAQAGGDEIQIYPDEVTDPGALNATAFGPGDHLWDYGYLPPGNWTITATDGASTRTQTVYVAPTPVLTLLDPDVAGGADYATTVFGDPWDLANAEDVTRFGQLYDIGSPRFGGAGLTATALAVGGDAVNAGAAYVSLLDSVLHPGASRIQAGRYHRLTFALEYLTGRDLPLQTAMSPTWGSMFRVAWQDDAHAASGVYSETLPVWLLDAGPQTFSMDLSALRATGTDPGLTAATPAPWSGSISSLRIPVTYASGADRPFRLSAVRLAADDEPTQAGFFNVRWSVSPATFSRLVGGGIGPDVRIALYYAPEGDRSRTTEIARDLLATDGSYAWNVQDLDEGRYVVLAVVADASGTSLSRWSTGPVRIERSLTPFIDGDTDGMADDWESLYGVDAPAGDEDGDGVRNLDEYRNGTDPLLPNRWVLPEGATSFFTEHLALANPTPVPATVDVKYLLEDGGPISRRYSVPGYGRISVRVNDVVTSTAVSAVVEAVTGGVVAERTMFWGAGWYGGHTGRAVSESRTQWFLAEGEANFFDTYILLANPNADEARVTIDYLREGWLPVRRTYDVKANARLSIYANEVPELAGHAFSASVDSDRPINVERAMYFTPPGKAFWLGGHEAAAVPAPAANWFVAEGSTAPMFDMYLLLANPNDQAVDATISFLKPGGVPPVVRHLALPPTSRTTVAVNTVDGLQSTDVSASISATGAIVVERAMYWPLGVGNWTEAHASAGITATGTRWVMAEGASGGPLGFDTYILLANPGDQEAEVTVTLLRSGNRDPVSTAVRVPPGARETLSAAQYRIESGEEFGFLVESTNGVPIVVERAMYWNGGGAFWGGGTNETAVRVR